MTCPTCGHEFVLTWSRYWKSILGAHTCPSCHCRLKVAFSASYFFLICALAFIFGGMPAVAVVFITHSVFYGAVLCAILAILVVFPFDRWMVDNHKTTRSLDSK